TSCWSTLSVPASRSSASQGKAEQLAATHSGRGGESPEREEAISLDLCEQPGEFLRGPSRSAALGRCRWVRRRGGIAAELAPSLRWRFGRGLERRPPRCRSSCTRR